jgi:CoA:oxalate CoA-transferase
MGDDDDRPDAAGGGGDLPLSGLLVLDFGQFLAGPVAALRLRDLGARVIKVERPQGGDSGRALAFADLAPDGDSLTFHIMNRGKESLAADLKAPEDLALVRRLVQRADVLIHNFRPGVMERYGLDYATVAQTNPGIVYASVSGYGERGPWRDAPGQDLLAQARAGVMWLSGQADGPPVPVGVSVVDQLAAHHLVQGILAALVRRTRTGRGAAVATSLLEAAVDLQFEFVAAALNAPGFAAPRPGRYGAHRFLPAPYGVYPTADGFLALAMNPLAPLAERIGLALTAEEAADASWAWRRRDAMNARIAERLATATTAEWLGRLEGGGIWCAPVLTLEEFLHHEGFAALEMAVDTVRTGADGRPVAVRTTRLPIRFDGRAARAKTDVGAPRLGEHTARIRAEFAAAGASPPAEA